MSTCFHGTATNVAEYNHQIQEFKKKSLPSSQLERTKELSAQNKLEMFFRGHQDISYKWEPSVFRDNYLISEDTIYSQCLSQFPGEFYGIRKIFDRLVKIQHYGGKTRLLDFTRDPLIALWFACEVNETETDGEVAIYWTTHSNVKELGVRCLSFLATYPSKIDTTFFDKLRKYLGENYSDDKLRDAMKQHYFVIPKKTNERVKRQDGVFLIFGQKHETEKSTSCLDENFGRGEDYPGYIGYISIPANAKKGILEELKNENKTKEYLMPNIEEGFREIVENSKRKNTI